ncbi:ATP-binding protein [uncultured Parabacteroides sp.]|uniref:sensor histidine kinase n=1 Tax=uncultured Parabacteroides sp. TaxID=512312 RepID=UPI00258F7A08|nr:ATP-binding protein [uncultured Parabacteroides sp.]
MKKRIRLIYILSLFAALSAIGVQGYWLYNQLQYEMHRYKEELVGKVKEVEEEEFNLRKQETLDTKATYVLNRNAEHSASSGSEMYSNTFAGLKFNLKDTTQTEQINLNFNPSMPEDSLLAAADRLVVNHFIPFSRERLDSLLKVRLPECVINYTSFSPKQQDGAFLPSSFIVEYMYSPLEAKGILMTVSFPFHPLLVRMAAQLGVSLFLVLLLISCLWFQISTILKQKKIGKMREDFVHTMIHELRRPIQALKMCVSFLNDPVMRADESTCREVALDAMFELDNLSAYLGKLKDMVCVDGGGTQLVLSSLDLPKLVEKVLRLIQIPPEKQVSFSTAYTPEVSLITADPVHIANVLCNLIENAIKYSGSDVHIRIVIMRVEKGIELSVEDNGFGISPAEHRKVFEKFYRSPGFSGKDIPGLGLGLSYVRQIVEAHHGKVSLQSKIGYGTKVIVTLPR